LHAPPMSGLFNRFFDLAACMNTIILLLNTLFLLATVFLCWKKTAVLKSVFLPALTVKVAMGILLGAIYTYYYTVGDTLVYVRDGNVIAQLARHDLSVYFQFLWSNETTEMLSHELILEEPRAVFLSKFVSFFSIVTGGNYWTISVYFSLISFFGCWYFVKQIHIHIPSVSWPAIVSFLFFPSIVFWTSGIIKESIAIGALSFIAGLLVNFWFTSKVRWGLWALAVVCGWVAWNLKYYFAAIFFSFVVATIIHKLIWSRRLMSFKGQSISWVIIFSLMIVISSFLHPNFSPTRFFRVIIENYQAFQVLSEPGDALRFGWMDEPNAKILYNAPAALFSGLYRPFVWEATDNFFQFWISIENFILAILTIVALRPIKQTTHSPHGILILAILMYVVILCILLTLSTPNFGTLSRYRTGYLPFFVLLLLSSPRIRSFMERSFNRLVR
jgi:hypothetical protein